jgi:hypothetical protein
MAERARLALRQEMTISRGAFLRNLPAAVGHVPFVVQGDEIAHESGRRAWRVVLSPLPPLRAGALALERHAVEIHLRGFDASAERAFLERFELHYRRGGG